jgi:aspartyl protease family protein
MQKALLLVLAGGGIIGLVWPTGPAPAPAPVTAARSDREPFSQAPPAETLLQRRADGYFYVDAEVNGELVNFVIDTGATSVVLPVETAQRLGLRFNESEFEVIGSGASGPVRGTFVDLDRVAINGKEVRHIRGAIAEGLDRPLLGQAYLSRLSSIEMSGDYMRLQ